MSTYEKVIDLCRKNNIKQTTLEAELGFGRGSIGKLRRVETSPKRLKAIADYFGVSVDYLLSDNDGETSNRDILVEIDNRTNDGTTHPKKEEYRKAIEGYYFSDETAKIAQELFDNYDYHILMDAARDLEPDKLHALASMALMLKGTNKDG